MRLLSSLLLMLVLATPTLATAQTVNSLDLVAKWQGNVVIHNSNEDKNVIGLLTLRSDSLWWEWVHSDGKGTNWATLYAGRWRLAGDTLWLVPTQQQQFFNWKFAQRDASIGQKADTVTTKPKPDSLFWASVKSNTGYKITLADRQLSLIRLDSLTTELRAAPVTVYTRVAASIP